MKKIAFLFAFFLILSCSDDDRQNNPFLPNIAVNFRVNLNLPQYNNLKFPGGIVVDQTQGIAIKGVIIYNQNDQQFFAYELSDPNVPVSDCSALSVNGTRASSNCEGVDNLYEIASFGQQIRGEGGFPLLAYRVRKDGNTLTITN